MINDNNNNLAKVYLNIKEKEKTIKGYWCLELVFFVVVIIFCVMIRILICAMLHEEQIYKKQK